MSSVALRGIIIGGNTGSHGRLGPAPAHSATGFGRRSLRAACCRVSAPTCQSGSSPASYETRSMRPFAIYCIIVEVGCLACFSLR